MSIQCNNTITKVVNNNGNGKPPTVFKDTYEGPAKAELEKVVKIKYQDDADELVKEELAKAKKEAKNFIDSDASVDTIVNLYFDGLKDGDYKDARKSYYDRKVKKFIGKKKAKDVLPMHLQKIIKDNIQCGDSPRTAKQAIEVLSPAFNIARANRIVVHNPCLDVKIELPIAKKIVVDATDRLKCIYKAIIAEYKDRCN